MPSHSSLMLHSPHSSPQLQIFLCSSLNERLLNTRLLIKKFKTQFADSVVSLAVGFSMRLNCLSTAFRKIADSFENE